MIAAARLLAMAAAVALLAIAATRAPLSRAGIAHAGRPETATDAAARMNGVARELAYGEDRAQRFDVYPPADPTGAPTVFLVHGGGWRHGDKAMRGVIQAKAQRWNAAGAFVVSANYRMLPQADPLTQAGDVARALAAAQAAVAAMGGDRAGFVLMGHSAGGHLVALLDAVPAMAREAGATPWRGTVLLDAGAVDVAATMTSPRGRLPLFRDAFGADPAYWRDASPLHRLSARSAPMLAVCASARRDSCPAHRAYLAKAAGFGTPTRLLAMPLSHAAINRDLGQDNAYTREVEGFLRGIGTALAP